MQAEWKMLAWRHLGSAEVAILVKAPPDSTTLLRGCPQLLYAISGSLSWIYQRRFLSDTSFIYSKLSVYLFLRSRTRQRSKSPSCPYASAAGCIVYSVLSVVTFYAPDRARNFGVKIASFFRIIAIAIEKQWVTITAYDFEMTTRLHGVWSRETRLREPQIYLKS
jgi:hypothetical protein